MHYVRAAESGTREWEAEVHIEDDSEFAWCKSALVNSVQLRLGVRDPEKGSM